MQAVWSHRVAGRGAWGLQAGVHGGCRPGCMGVAGRVHRVAGRVRGATARSERDDPACLQCEEPVEIGRGVEPVVAEH